MMMNLIIEHESIHYECDMQKPIIASCFLNNGNHNPNAFHLPMPFFVPFQMGTFIGSRKAGGPVNCEILTLAPHGNGTHTECVGHIAKEHYTIAHTFTSYHAFGLLGTITPQLLDDGSRIITRHQIERILEDRQKPEALIIRTQHSVEQLQSKMWSGQTPPYFAADAMALLAERSIHHILTDLPSIDPEEDGGALAAHHAFWQYPQATRTHATVTEMIAIPDSIEDGYYLVNFGIAPLESDASPSMITLYPLIQAK